MILGFRIRDLFVGKFVYEKDTSHYKKGETGVMLKGRPLKVGFAKVDGESMRLAHISSPESLPQVA